MKTVVILSDAPAALAELCGVSNIQRLLRSLERLGVGEVVILSSTADAVAKALSLRAPGDSEITWRMHARSAGAARVEDIVSAASGGEMLLILPGDIVWDERLLRLLLSCETAAALVDSAPPEALQPFLAAMPQTSRGWLTGAAVLRTEELSDEHGPVSEFLHRSIEDQRLEALDIEAQPSYSLSARRELRPLWIPPTAPAQRKQAERLILNAAQKGALDLPAWVHAPIETWLVSKLCKTSVTPNQLTAVCNVAAWAAAILFAIGQLGWGTALALSVGVLDGLDGKLARVKVQTTQAGKLEHWLDKLYELAWAFALAYHFHASGALPNAFTYLFVFLAAEGIDGVAKLSVIHRYGRLIDELSPLDRAIRLFAGRRNIYVWILAVALLLGAPAKSFVVIAWWEGISAAVHVARAFWTIAVRPLNFSAASTAQPPDPRSVATGDNSPARRAGT